ncbi:AraC family transcriptional regulator [Paenibacillus sp. GCM10012303]|uniref:AraC family transcriptional regulator n=1 Tax=Paenibacillus sp. GCM10012303 TaxID=3317340 RepID=UPI0036185675
MAKTFLFYVLDLGWFECRPDYRIRRTFFPYSIRYVIDGKGYGVWRGKTYEVGTNQILFLNLTEEHEFYADPDDPCKIFWVRFGGLQTAHYHQMLECDKNPVLDIRNARLMRQLFEELFVLFEQGAPGFEVTASSHITRILTDAAVTYMEGNESPGGRPSHKYPETVHQAIRYIVNNYQEPIKIEDIASHVHLSPSYFSRLFKRVTGCTVTEYLIKYRLRIAKELLTGTDGSLGEIAHTAGFCSQSYFSKMFRQFDGMTPLEYRRSIRMDLALL